MSNMQHPVMNHNGTRAPSREDTRDGHHGYMPAAHPGGVSYLPDARTGNPVASYSLPPNGATRSANHSSPASMSVEGSAAQRSQGPSNPLEFPPYVKYSEWRRMAASGSYTIIFNGENAIPIPRSNVQLHPAAVSFSYSWSTPYALRLPFTFEVRWTTSDGNSNFDTPGVGNKRRLEGGSAGSAAKIKKTGPTSRTNSDTGYGFAERSKSLSLFRDEVIRLTDGYWTDRGGRIKIFAHVENDNQSIQINNVYFNTHGRWFLQDMPVNRFHSSDRLLGFRDYAIFVTIRDSESGRVLFEHQSLGENVRRVESPYRQTVSLELLKGPVKLSSFILPTREGMPCDASRLVADLVIFDCFQNVFSCRSAYLWVDSHTPTIYYGSMLAATDEDSYMNIQFRAVNPQTTELRSCSVTIALKKIRDHFKRNGIPKIPELSQYLVNLAPKEDPMDIFK